MLPLADAAGNKRDETAQPHSIYHVDHCCVELQEHFMATVTSASVLTMYVLG